MLTIVDPQAYSPDEYNIVALPSSTLKQRIIAIQKELVDILGDAIWLTPANALHMTIMEITGPHTQPVEKRSEWYTQWSRDYGQLTKEIIATFPPLSLHLSQILVSERAIILKAADPKALNAARSALLSKTRLPEGTQLPPDIAHISIARFSKAIDLDRVAQDIGTLNIACDEHITSLSLLKDITPPDFDITVIDTYPLAS